MYIRLISFLSSNGIHNSHQHGFRQNHNASTACTDVLNFVTEELDEKRLVLYFLMYLKLSIAYLTQFSYLNCFAMVLEESYINGFLHIYPTDFNMLT